MRPLRAQGGLNRTGRRSAGTWPSVRAQEVRILACGGGSVPPAGPARVRNCQSMWDNSRCSPPGGNRASGKSPEPVSRGTQTPLSTLPLTFCVTQGHLLPLSGTLLLVQRGLPYQLPPLPLPWSLQLSPLPWLTGVLLEYTFLFLPASDL